MVKKNKRGICPLCLTVDTDLRISHVIPDAIFRNIKENGKAWNIQIKENIVEKTQDSWATRMLCGECEHLLNSKFENQALVTLRKGLKKRKSGHYVTLKNINTLSMAYFILSMIWRASLSKHDSFKDIKLPEKAEDFLRLTINKPSSKIFQSISFRIFHLVDSSGFFNEGTMANLLIQPYIDNYDDERTAIVFIFEGYRLECIIPGLSGSSSTNRGVLVHLRDKLKVPAFDIWGDALLSETFIDAGKVLRSQKG